MKNMSTVLRLTLPLLLALTVLTQPGFATDDVFEMDLSSLMEMQITSAGRKEQNLADVAAAVYVIDAEAIRNSSSTSLPELLRMVPGLQVARIGSSEWGSYSARFCRNLFLRASRTG